MKPRQLLTEYLILPISDIVNRQSVYRWLQFLKRSALWNDEQMRDFQNERFRILIHHAATHVPYYRDWFRQNGATPNDFRNIEDLSKLPIVSKSIMRHEGVDRFVADNITKRLTAHSSGSTGEPFEYYITREAYSLNTAAKLRTWYDADYRLGDRYVKLSSSPRESRIKRLQDKLTNGIVIPFHSLDDQTLASILDLFEQTKPSIIRTHPNAIYYLARYREEHPGKYTYTPRHIMTTSATLPAPFRTTIERAFGCDVIDAYSCEGTPNTAESPLHDGYHVSREYGILEVLDSDGKPIQHGVGRSVGTDLWNMAMPFIRYDTQDLLMLDDHGSISRIVGRKCELLSSSNGKRFTGQVIDDYFSYQTQHSVDAFQVVRRKDGSVLIRLIVNDRFNEGIRQSVADYWSSELDTPVEVQTVEHIPLMHNNKYLTIIDE